MRGFSLPPELGWFGAAGSAAAHPLGRVFSPFQEAYFQTLGQTPAGLAYFPLLLLSLASFVQNLRERWPWQRFWP